MNQHTQKKNCLRCKAYQQGSNSPPECRLGYKLCLVSFDDFGMLSFSKPLEPCPKPKTYRDFFYAERHMRKAQGGEHD